MLVCPHCDLVSKGGGQDGQHCVLIEQRGERMVLLKEHLERPSPEAIQEATKMLFKVEDGRVGVTGMIDETDVAGHWGMKLIPSQFKGESKAHSS